MSLKATQSEIDHSAPGLVKKSADVDYDSKKIYIQSNFEKNLEYFHIMGHEESHSVRRREILSKHPEIQILFGPDSVSLWMTIGIVSAQIILASYFSTSNLFVYVASSFILAGTFSHALFVLIHDLTHYTCFDNLDINKFLAIIANIGQGIPSAITFGRYHADHHTFLNLVNLDPDLPSDQELKYIRGPIMKAFFIILLPVFYAIRPIVIRPLKPNIFEILNFIIILAVDVTIVKFINQYALIWLLLGTYFGLRYIFIIFSIHPFAGHFIAEHYEFINRLETYDYIGWINFFNLNIGYHIEHHDFPMIPWTRLPLLRKMAPEYYEHFPCHPNYIQTVLHYIFDGYIGPFSRIVRKIKQ